MAAFVALVALYIALVKCVTLELKQQELHTRAMRSHQGRFGL